MHRLSLAIISSTLPLSACSSDLDGQTRLTLPSDMEEQSLATCISQNWSAAFPRFFPSTVAGSGKSFRTYNGIVVSIVSQGERRAVVVRSPNPLSRNMVDYLRKCTDGSFHR